MHSFVSRYSVIMQIKVVTTTNVPGNYATHSTPVDDRHYFKVDTSSWILSSPIRNAKLVFVSVRVLFFWIPPPSFFLIFRAVNNLNYYQHNED